MVDCCYSFTNAIWLHGVHVLVMLLVAQDDKEKKEVNDSLKGLVGALPSYEPHAIDMYQCKNSENMTW